MRHDRFQQSLITRIPDYLDRLEAQSAAGAGFTILENGRVVLDGDAERLRTHPDIQEFYLGQSGSGKRRSYRDIKQYRRSRRWYG